MNDVLLSDFLMTLLLLSVPGLPLLLAFPVLHSRLPWFRYLALLPAVIAVAIPESHSVELPWLLFGTELGIENSSRLLLAMSVFLWLGAMVLLPVARDRSEGRSEDKYLTVFFLLSMTGNFGAILAMDLVIFFVFSTLLGYGFYGLLVSGRKNKARRAGRVYLVLLILADLVLFEVLLITALTTENLGFAAVHQSIAQSDSLTLYLSLVVVAFAARAGIWPLHFWLPLAYRSTRPAVALLLGIPVVIGLLGIVRWLPLGEISSPELGLIIFGLGVVAMLFAIFAGLKMAQLKVLPAYAAILVTGLFFTAIGAGLADPAIWSHYGRFSYVFIASLGSGLAVLVFALSWLQARRDYPARPAGYADDSSQWYERWSGVAVVWAGNTGFDTLPRWRAWWLAKMRHLWLLIRIWKRQMGVYERSLQRWGLAITLFLLLAITITFVMASAGTSSLGHL